MFARFGRERIHAIPSPREQAAGCAPTGIVVHPNQSGVDFKSGEKRGGSVARALVRVAPKGVAVRCPQPPLGPFQLVNAWLLVDVDDRRVLRGATKSSTMSAALAANCGPVFTYQLCSRITRQRMTRHTWWRLTSPRARASGAPFRETCPPGEASSGLGMMRPRDDSPQPVG